jgi:hypothetical protein
MTTQYHLIGSPSSVSMNNDNVSIPSSEFKDESNKVFSVHRCLKIDGNMGNMLERTSP